MNPNYAAHVKEEIDKLLKAGCIRPVKQATWLSPIVVVSKKNGKLRMTIMNVFPLPFTDSVLLDAVASHDMYSFLDGFNGYNQVCMHLDDEDKTAFITDWGVYVAVVMMFGLKTAPTTFQRTIKEIFGEYIPAFMQVFLDDFAVYGTGAEHLAHLWLYLERCRTSRLSVNLAKCAFGITNGTFLGHIISQDGIVVDPHKVKTIMDAPPPMNTKSLSRFLGQIRWHSQMIKYLTDVVTPLHATTHKTPF